ncbi:MAG: D-alanine--D-alanine ligase [Bacteroidota bacterium]|jgi:D-alanine-D-alanine ligase|nr:D-alanine--D-alanine ligase [Bacteroidota bacterium]
MKIRVGIIFGGFSKEREISFAGGRTVYDNLNKSLFEAVPVFVDSFGNFVLLNWEYVYKGSVRDFYPPAEFIPEKNGDFQVYAEQIGNLSSEQQLAMINKIGSKIAPEDLKQHFDFAFLCLHGPFGEDGKIQGLCEYLNIPYSGSGILPSAIGIDKGIQKQLMVNAGFNSPKFFTVDRDDYISGNCKNVFERAGSEIGFPLVVKPANQGSSIGISILHKEDKFALMEAIEKAFFTKWQDATEWNAMKDDQKISFVRSLADIREGIGMPLLVISDKLKSKEAVFHPADLIAHLDHVFKTENEGVILAAVDGESKVLIEGFIEGKEFSCIVAQKEDGNPVALPPTEIRKGKELFDYRSKYLPGLSRKITPIDLPNEQIQMIRRECERLFKALSFDVYARIDGFLSKDGKIFLNDPNTTSGMMPSSFFFHQAAEIGLNPSQFLTYIIRTSLSQRITGSRNSGKFDMLLETLDASIKQEKESTAKKIKVAVILGGYSSERHISVESGRNIYEKLASSSKYEPIPVFLTGSDKEHILYQIPVNILLKDNADDIKEKIDNYKIHEMIKQIISECSDITSKYSSSESLAKPKRISYEDLSRMVEGVFIALHGRPGEDGAVQAELESVGLPYNGSGVDSSQITIDKYRTNELLKENGFLIAEHLLVTEEEWHADKKAILKTIENKIHFPFIAKPVDDGCSSAVRKIKTPEEFEAFATLIFRKKEELDQASANLLHIKEKEEFPQKRVILVEELISKRDAFHFLEITGGMLTKYEPDGKVMYEVFEASEALSEGEVLSLEEKFLAGQGQNITPARYSPMPEDRQKISDKVKETLGAAAKVLNVNGYCRIDAFVRIYNPDKVEVVFIEVNSLPGMTPATCIFHQTAINGYKPYDFIDRILDFGFKKQKALTE